MAEIVIETGVGWANIREAIDRATADDVVVVRHEGLAALARARAANRGLSRTVIVRGKEVPVGSRD